MLLSFMEESRRLDNGRMKRELGCSFTSRRCGKDCVLVTDLE